jgi:hypothetical protein
METKNIYDFLHLLSQIKIRPNTNFGGDLVFAHICHNTFLFILFFFQRVEKGSQAKTNVKGKKHTMVFIHFFLHLIFSN